MKALCAGRPPPGMDCATATPHPVASLKAAALSLMAALRARAGDSVLGVGVGGLGRREASAVKMADRYMSARMSGRNREVLSLVSPDVTLTSSRDGEVRGKQRFAEYLARTPPTGRWQRAAWNAAKQRAEVKGMVKVVFVPVSVIAHFGFDRRGRINDIYVGTKR